MSSDSEYDENASDQQSEDEQNGNKEVETTSNGATNDGDSEKPMSWQDLVCLCKIFYWVNIWPKANTSKIVGFSWAIDRSCEWIKMESAIKDPARSNSSGITRQRHHCIGWNGKWKNRSIRTADSSVTTWKPTTLLCSRLDTDSRIGLSNWWTVRSVGQFDWRKVHSNRRWFRYLSFW